MSLLPEVRADIQLLKDDKEQAVQDKEAAEIFFLLFQCLYFLSTFFLLKIINIQMKNKIAAMAAMVKELTKEVEKWKQKYKETKQAYNRVQRELDICVSIFLLLW